MVLQANSSVRRLSCRVKSPTVSSFTDPVLIASGACSTIPHSAQYLDSTWMTAHACACLRCARGSVRFACSGDWGCKETNSRSGERHQSSPDRLRHSHKMTQLRSEWWQLSGDSLGTSMHEKGFMICQTSAHPLQGADNHGALSFA